MSRDTMTPAEQARYEGLLTAVVLVYADAMRLLIANGLDADMVAADGERFQRALLELTDFTITLGWEAATTR